MQNNWINGLILIIILIMLPPFTGGSIKGKEKEKIEAVLTNMSDIDVCGDKNAKQVIVALEIGNVAYSDSLFGFNFELNYNQDKIKFNSALYLNTLSEFFELKEVGFLKGQVRGSLLTGIYDKQVYGNKPLIAFLGEYTQNCSDTTMVNISYVEFTDEFQKEVTSYKSALIEGKVAEKSDRIMKTIFNKYKFDSVSVNNYFNVRYQYSTKYKVNQIDLLCTTEKDSLIKIDSIVSINKKVKIDTSIKNGKSWLLKSTVLDSVNQEDVFRIYLSEVKKLSDSTKISLNSIVSSNCSCISKVKDTSIIVYTHKEIDTTSHVDEINRNVILINSNEINIDDYNEIKELNIYTVNGELIKKIDQNYLENKKVELSDLKNGIYYIIIKLNKEYKRIILIKTNY